ncbi:UL16-binding protein 1-like [Orycteropus afer afer]|uniref:UL16-binding protein 1-like n=1 Tax=Orycteropus afer afer TaxID=1230840 RepID=A0A8B7A5I3_ORYAF|nr:UL16-binding protein 1-like [Orycteropus afer afer]
MLLKSCLVSRGFSLPGKGGPDSGELKGFTALPPGALMPLVLLLLLPLLVCTWTARPDVHSLSYNFTVMFKSPPGRQWCEVQGYVDEHTFLHYNCGSKKVMNLTPLGARVISMKEWEEQTQTLKDVGEELKQQIPNIELENYTTRAPLTLQAKMYCQRDSGEHTKGFWEFGFDSQLFLLFNSENMKWTEIHPGARLVRAMWKKNRDLNKFLKRTSEGDCNRWLKEFWGHWEKMLEPRTQFTTAPASAQPTTAGAVNPWILLMMLTCLILLCIQC